MAKNKRFDDRWLAQIPADVWLKITQIDELKSQYIARRAPIEVSIFNEPIFQQQGGLNQILRIFGEDLLKKALAELNQRVFIGR